MNSNVSKICRTAETIGLFPLTNSIRICCIDIQTGLMCLAGDITPSVTHHSHTLRLSLETPKPGGIPIFSPGWRPTRNSSTGCISLAFGSPSSGGAPPDPCDFPGAAPPLPLGPGVSSPRRRRAPLLTSLVFSPRRCGSPLQPSPRLPPPRRVLVASAATASTRLSAGEPASVRTPCPL